MKKIMLSMALLVATMSGCAADGKVHVKGDLKNVTDTLLALTQQTMNNPVTVLSKDGKFEFDFPTDQVTSIFIVSPELLKGQRNANSVQMQLLAVPGESMELAVKAFETKGQPAKMHLACIIGSRVGVRRLEELYADRDDVTLWCAAIDPELNARSYIVPGLGDAGDLAFGGKI